MAKILSFFFFLLLVLQNAIAQDFRPAYQITLERDTVKGLVNYSPDRIRNGQCEFKLDHDHASELFEPGMITGFGFYGNDQFYESFTVPRENKPSRVFAELLLRGRADLLSYKDFFYLRKDAMSERIEKNQVKASNASGGRYVYSHKTYIGTLNRYFSDCLPQKLLKGDVVYSEKDFVDIFKKYSECSGREYYIYKNIPQARKVKFVILLGINNSKLEYPDRETDIFNPDNNFFFGGGIEIPLTFISEKIFLTGEATYHHNEYRGKKEGYTSTGTVQKDYSVDIDVVRTPIGIKFNLIKRNFTPYIKSGLTPLFPLRTRWKIEYQGASEVDYEIKEKTASIVVWGGFGFQRKMTSGQGAFVEVRLEKVSDYIGFYGPSGTNFTPSSVLNKMLVVGFSF